MASPRNQGKIQNRNHRLKGRRLREDLNRYGTINDAGTKGRTAELKTGLHVLTAGRIADPIAGLISGEITEMTGRTGRTEMPDPRGRITGTQERDQIETTGLKGTTGWTGPKETTDLTAWTGRTEMTGAKEIDSTTQDSKRKRKRLQILLQLHQMNSRMRKHITVQT